jgi:hypothetical protein
MDDGYIPLHLEFGEGSVTQQFKVFPEECRIGIRK